MAKPVKKAASAKTAANKVVRTNTPTKKTAAKALVQSPAKRGAKKVPVEKVRSTEVCRGPAVSASLAPATPSTIRPVSITPQGLVQVRDQRPLPESVDEDTIARLVAEAEDGVPAEKLRRRGRPAIGDEAAITYSVRLPDDLVTLADERSEIDGVTRSETIRRALIEYLTK
jgi:Ribbon-helix-helix protein, copG family